MAEEWHDYREEQSPYYRDKPVSTGKPFIPAGEWHITFSWVCSVFALCGLFPLAVVAFFLARRAGKIGHRFARQAMLVSVIALVGSIAVLALANLLAWPFSTSSGWID